MRSRAVVAGALLCALSACGSSPDVVASTDPVPEPAGATSPAATTTSGPDYRDSELESPPPFRVRYDDQEIQLAPYTFCFGNGCADGAPVDPPHVGSPGRLLVLVPVEGWDLTVDFSRGQCGRSFPARPQPAGGGWWVVEPAGPAGSYDVTLSARGNGGDMFAQLGWTTTTEGATPDPKAMATVIADNDGRPDSYGVDLSLIDMATTPDRAEGTVTVTAANGESRTIALRRDRADCTPDGSLYFAAAESEGTAASLLGDFPFRYDVTVTLDGRTHRATATFPDDQVKDQEPSVRLDFQPPLPAMR